MIFIFIIYKLYQKFLKQIKTSEVTQSIIRMVYLVSYFWLESIDQNLSELIRSNLERLLEMAVLVSTISEVGSWYFVWLDCCYREYNQIGVISVLSICGRLCIFWWILFSKKMVMNLLSIKKWEYLYFWLFFFEF